MFRVRTLLLVLPQSKGTAVALDGEFIRVFLDKTEGIDTSFRLAPSPGSSAHFDKPDTTSPVVRATRYVMKYARADMSSQRGGTRIVLFGKYNP